MWLVSEDTVVECQGNGEWYQNKTLYKKKQPKSSIVLKKRLSLQPKYRMNNEFYGSARFG